MDRHDNAILPHAQVKNVRIFYILTVFTNGWFINANWIFLALTLMTRSRLGLIDGLSFLIGTLVDLPSGALADFIGRKRTMIIARSVFVLSCALFIVSYNQWMFSIANVLFFVGSSFYAGADQALLYDSLKEHGLERDYLRIAARADLISKISTFLSSIVGAYFFAMNIRYPFVLLFIFALLALGTTFFLEEVGVITKHSFSMKSFVKQQFEGVRVLLGPKLRAFVPIFFVILGTLVVYQWGILRGFMAIQYRFGGSEQSVVFGTLSFTAGLIGLLLPHLVSRSSEARVSMALSIVYVAGFALFGLFTDVKAWGLLILFLISLSGNLINVLSQKIVNDHVDSKLRATALSALSIVTKIPYVLLAYPIGIMAENNFLTYVTGSIAILSTVAVIALFLMKKSLRTVKREAETLA